MNDESAAMNRRGLISRIGFAAVGGVIAVGSGMANAQMRGKAGENRHPGLPEPKGANARELPRGAGPARNSWSNRMAKDPKQIAVYLRAVADSLEKGSSAPMNYYMKANPDYSGPIYNADIDWGKVGRFLRKLGAVISGLGDTICAWSNNC